jgi:predicted nucleic acid-binding protein
VANGLARLVVGGLFPSNLVGEAWQTVSSLPIIYHGLEVSGERVVSMSLELRRQSAYDTAYISLTQELEAELWTFDGPLARNANGQGYPLHLME